MPGHKVDRHCCPVDIQDPDASSPDPNCATINCAGRRQGVLCACWVEPGGGPGPDIGPAQEL